MQIAICIATFRRRQRLQVLLRGISQLTFRKVPRPDIAIVVVDNDVNGTARDVCMQAALPWPVKYFIEPRRGITYVRNRTIAEAGDVDFVVTIDDDEVPVAEWLDELLWTQAQYSADIVNGPVKPQFEANVADWVKHSGLFNALDYSTGTTITFCYTGNSLIRSAVFSDVPLFDDRFALTGGEDTHFFLRARHAGYKIVWSREAVAYESISIARANAMWILRRQYQIGNTWTFCELSLDVRMQTRFIRFAKASCFIVMGAVSAPVSIFLGKAAFVRALQPVYRGLGMLTALAGSRYFAYRSAGTDCIEPGLQSGTSALSRPIVE